MKKQLVFTGLAIFAMATAVQGATIRGIIKSVTPVSSSQEATIEDFVDGVNIYKDRDPGHRLVNIPVELQTDRVPRVIQNSNSDKTRADYQLDVTTQDLGIIYIGLDSRFADQQPLPWMQDTSKTKLPTVFFDTGITIDIDEGSTQADAGNDIDNQFNLWATIAPPGTYSFFEQSYGGGSNNYFIAADDHLVTAVIPEPSTFALIGLGLVGLLSGRRRRK